MKYLDYISDEAARIGAVNTVMLKANKHLMDIILIILALKSCLRVRI